jgi:preprotein translocase subunit SecY
VSPSWWGRLAAVAGTAELRTKVLLTLSLILLFRIGAMLPAPGIDFAAIQSCIDTADDDSFLTVVNLFSGGALGKVSLLALGVMPYITASIMMQLLQAVVPKLAAMKKDGGAEAAKLTQWTRYGTIGLAIVQAVGLVWAAQGTPSTIYQQCLTPITTATDLSGKLVLGSSLVVGALFVMWLGEQITERGIGNGVSLMMFASIAATLPSQLTTLGMSKGATALVIAGLALVALLTAIVFVEQGQRRIPVRYAKTNAVGVAASYTPFKVNMAGIVPIIYASSMLYAPVIASNLLGKDNSFGRWVEAYLVSGEHPVYYGIYLVLVVFFAFFQVSITHNPAEMSEKLASSGGYIPGIRPGQDTENYLGGVIGRLTTAGAGYLALVALLPLIALSSLGSGQLPLGGTALLILVNVALETTRQFQSQARQHLPYERGIFSPATTAKKDPTHV